MNITYSKQSLKFLEQSEKTIQKRIVEKIGSLDKDPVPHKAVLERRLFSYTFLSGID